MSNDIRVDHRSPADLVSDAVRPDDTVLEVGAGDGSLADELRARGLRVVATDAEPAGAGVISGDLRRLPDEVVGRFDAVVASRALHHIAPLGEAAEALAALVRPGGLLIVDDLDHGAVGPREAAWLTGWLAKVDSDWQPATAEACLEEFHRDHTDLHRWPTVVASLMPSFRTRRVWAAPALARGWCGGDESAESDERTAITGGRIAAVGRRLVVQRRM